jgi:hypothetical protein
LSFLASLIICHLFHTYRQYVSKHATFAIGYGKEFIVSSTNLHPYE